MIYGYIRVSTDKQTVENQRFEISNWCQKQEMIIGGWIEDNAISGKIDPSKRELGKLLKKVKKDDVIVCSELSRLGRSLLMIMSILNYCMEKDVKIYTIKDNYRLGDDIQSKVLAFAFGLSAEIERNLISQRTKEALARKKAEGVVLGRPVGRKSSTTKLSGREKVIKKLLDKGMSYSAIGKLLGVHRLTVSAFIKERMDDKGNYVPVDGSNEYDYIRLEDFKQEIIKKHLKDEVPVYQLAKEYETSRLVISNIIRFKDIEAPKQMKYEQIFN